MLFNNENENANNAKFQNTLGGQGSLDQLGDTKLGSLSSQKMFE